MEDIRYYKNISSDRSLTPLLRPRNRGNGAVFLDRDGTIIEDNGYIGNQKDIVFIPGIFESLRELSNYFILFIVTNQSGVGLGKISRESAVLANGYVVKCLADEGIPIQRVYSCMHTKEDNCICMKPKPHFLLKSRDEFGINLEQSFVIGDHPHDIEFARNGGATGLYVLTGHGRKHLGELTEDMHFFPDILAAVDWLMKSIQLQKV